MKAYGWFVTLCLVLATVSIAADDDRAPVGRLGDPARLLISGAQTYTAAEIRDAVFNELEIVAACDEYAPLDALTALVAAKITAGYQCCGFPDVNVTVSAHKDQLEATIQEGDRYSQGEVQIAGCRLSDAQRIKNGLTVRKANGAKRPIWEAGEPASFNSENEDWLLGRVAGLLDDQGFFRATSRTAIKADRTETKQAHLEIEIVDEGPRCVFGDVEIVGNTAHSREAMLAFLGIALPAPLTRDLREEIERRLLGTGRFSNVHWELGEAGQRDDNWRPRLLVQEYESAPALGAALTREEAAVLKLADWVERFEAGEQELLMRFAELRVSIVFAPRHGFILVREPEGKADAANDRTGFESALVMAEERVGLYSSRQRRKIDAAPPPSPIMGNAEILLVAGPPSPTGGGRLSVGAGLRPASSSALRRHVKMQLELTAAAALSVVRTH